MTLIWALYVCACGYEERVRLPVNVRVTPEHDCRLKEATSAGRESKGSATPAS